MNDISEANLIELFKSFAVNGVLGRVDITGGDLQHFDSCKERVLELLLENNFSLKAIWLYQSSTDKDFPFNAFVNRNKYLRKQRRFKAVKPVNGCAFHGSLN